MFTIVIALISNYPISLFCLEWKQFENEMAKMQIPVELLM